MLCDNEEDVVIIDFGISSVKGGSNTVIVTKTGMTPEYSASETFRNLFLEESDYYSLGITLGQFVICGDKLYYIDLATSSLVAFDMTTSETEEVVRSAVSSFVVAGNNIIFLGSDHILYEMNLGDHSQTTVGKNITEFAYNGKLWMQNNEKVYSKSLDKKAIKEYPFDIQCNRLLGITETQMFVESEDGIYMYDLESGVKQKITEGVFVGGSSERMLIYDTSERIYYVKVLTSIPSQ